MSDPTICGVETVTGTCDMPAGHEGEHDDRPLYPAPPAAGTAALPSTHRCDGRLVHGSALDCDRCAPPAAGTGTPPEQNVCTEGHRATYCHHVASRLRAAEAERDEARAKLRECVLLRCVEGHCGACAACVESALKAQAAAAEAEVRRLSGELASLRDGLRELALAAEAVSDEHGPIEDEECDHCALMWRQLNAAIEKTAALLGEDGGTR